MPSLCERIKNKHKTHSNIAHESCAHGNNEKGSTPRGREAGKQEARAGTAMLRSQVISKHRCQQMAGRPRVYSAPITDDEMMSAAHTKCTTGIRRVGGISKIDVRAACACAVLYLYRYIFFYMNTKSYKSTKHTGMFTHMNMNKIYETGTHCKQGAPGDKEGAHSPKPKRRRGGSAAEAEAGSTPKVALVSSVRAALFTTPVHI
jgi:hypothetical protein